MEKYILPFALDVEMKTYHSTAFLLGILKANIADYDSWLCDKFIQMLACNGDSHFCCTLDPAWPVEDELFFRQTMRLSPETFQLNGFNLIDFNKAMLKDNNYIAGEYNERYIPGKKSYGECDYTHDYIIFGFDDENMVFKSAGYVKDGTYRYFDIKYADYYKSIIENRVNPVMIDYIRLNPEYVVTIDITDIKEQMEDYLYSRWNPRLKSEDLSEHHYGTNAWDKLADYVMMDCEYGLDLRFGRLFMEHRNVMYKRLIKLSELAYIKNCQKLLDDYYKNVFTTAATVYHLFIKYNLTHQNGLLSRMVNCIEQANGNERELLKVVVAQLQQAGY